MAARDPIPDLPSTLGPCSGLSLIGQGAMGAVYRAHHARLGHDVAVKVIHPRLGAHDPKLYQRFLREVRLLRQIEHPHVVRILDAGQDGRFVYAVMELVVGRSLGDIRTDAGGRLEPGEVAFYLAQVARGLGAVHGAGTVHRDIKPDNVIVDEVGRARIADFGLARGQSSSQLTMADEVVGTPEYMAPETVQHQEVDGRADIYALGITAYELLSGATPFNQGGLLRVVQDQVSRMPLPLLVKVPGLPIGLCDLVHRMIEKDPARRPATAAEAAALLEAFATPCRPKPASAGHPRPTAPPPPAPAAPAAAAWGGAVVSSPATDPRGTTARRAADASGRLPPATGVPASGRSPQVASGRQGRQDPDPRAGGDGLIEPIVRSAPPRDPYSDTDPRRPGTDPRATGRLARVDTDPRATGRRVTDPPDVGARPDSGRAQRQDTGPGRGPPPLRPAPPSIEPPRAATPRTAASGRIPADASSAIAPRLPAGPAAADLDGDGLPGWVALGLVRLLAAHRIYPLDTLLDGLEAWRRLSPRPGLDGFLVSRAALPEETARKAVDAARREALGLRDRVALGLVRSVVPQEALDRALRARRKDEPLAPALVREGALARADAQALEARIDAALADARARACRGAVDPASWRAAVRGLVAGL